MTRPDQTRAEVQAIFARVDACFDAVMADADSLLAKYREAKLLRSPQERTRNTDVEAQA